MNIAIVIPCYNASETLPSVLKRIPNQIWTLNPNIIIVEDGGSEVPPSVNDKLLEEYPNLIIEVHQENGGYGTAQKTGFTKALELGSESIALLHADGQYAPELLPTLLEPLIQKKADVVMGSRMLIKENALKGNMPYYKFLANSLLTKIENFFFRSSFSEFHSGYMLYSSHALETIPFLNLTDKFHFDGEMLIMSNIKKLTVEEIAIPTHYGDEVSYLNPISYGAEILRTLLKYLTGHYHKL